MKFDLEQFKQGVKAKTRDGRIATFIGICEGCDEYEQLVTYVEGCKYVHTFNMNGAYLVSEVYRNNDLVSMVSPWEDVPIDAKVRVRNSYDGAWVKRHYAGLRDGSPTAWNEGNTSWTACSTESSHWEFMELVG